MSGGRQTHYLERIDGQQFIDGYLVSTHICPTCLMTEAHPHHIIYRCFHCGTTMQPRPAIYAAWGSIG